MAWDVFNRKSKHKQSKAPDGEVADDAVKIDGPAGITPLSTNMTMPGGSDLTLTGGGQRVPKGKFADFPPFDLGGGPPGTGGIVKALPVLDGHDKPPASGVPDEPGWTTPVPGPTAGTQSASTAVPINVVKDNQLGVFPQYPIDPIPGRPAKPGKLPVVAGSDSGPAASLGTDTSGSNTDSNVDHQFEGDEQGENGGGPGTGGDTGSSGDTTGMATTLGAGPSRALGKLKNISVTTGSGGSTSGDQSGANDNHEFDGEEEGDNGAGGAGAGGDSGDITGGTAGAAATFAGAGPSRALRGLKAVGPSPRVSQSTTNSAALGSGHIDTSQYGSPIPSGHHDTAMSPNHFGEMNNGGYAPGYSASGYKPTGDATLDGVYAPDKLYGTYNVWPNDTPSMYLPPGVQPYQDYKLNYIGGDSSKPEWIPWGGVRYSYWSDPSQAPQEGRIPGGQAPDTGRGTWGGNAPDWAALAGGAGGAGSSTPDNLISGHGVSGHGFGHGVAGHGFGHGVAGHGFGHGVSGHGVSGHGVSGHGLAGGGGSGLPPGHQDWSNLQHTGVDWKLVYIGGDKNNATWVPWGDNSPLGYWSSVSDADATSHGIRGPNPPVGNTPWGPSVWQVNLNVGAHGGRLTSNEWDRIPSSSPTPTPKPGGGGSGNTEVVVPTPDYVADPYPGVSTPEQIQADIKAAAAGPADPPLQAFDLGAPGGPKAM